MVQFNVNATLNTSKVKKRADKAFGRSQYILDNQVLKDSNYFIPKDEGFLEGSGITHSQLGEGVVSWKAPQARRLYYNPQYNFSKDKNPNSRGLWFEAAKAKDRKAWLDIAKKEFESNFNR